MVAAAAAARAQAAKAAARANFWKKYYSPEVIPIVVITGIACVGASAYLYKLAMGNEVVWNRKGDWAPWDKVRYDQNTKLSSMFNYNSEFWEKRKKEYLEQQAALHSADGKRMVDKV
ncbi:hypothetical protein BD324DRAFT_627240 [Kockovaella imperatae]|uniref:NADH-ubiquinone reductase complex 1 MLRQ subunit-domain-containing protein n=1 Tax=Kockovaella imperatae TaxID=4999 RepID=A0A1Y1UFH7_9TREE|nr:hypothetical protein BD324DRAFT_627240 [Kockovaella imperatae]ORX36811.1 hypothetical protein BD324DRAFT_627240 [Kockovaella imperatae]